MDERGYVKIVGRIKEMIIRGGENIYPKYKSKFTRNIKTITDFIMCVFKGKSKNSLDPIPALAIFK